MHLPRKQENQKKYLNTVRYDYSVFLAQIQIIVLETRKKMYKLTSSKRQESIKQTIKCLMFQGRSEI